MAIDRYTCSAALTTTGIIHSSYSASVRKSQQCPNGLMRKRERQRETDRGGGRGG